MNKSGNCASSEIAAQEYEDFTIELLNNPSLLDAIRAETKVLRTKSRLFNTKYWTSRFTTALQSIWEQYVSKKEAVAGSATTKQQLRDWHLHGTRRPTSHFHIFGTDAPEFTGDIDIYLGTDGTIEHQYDKHSYSERFSSILKQSGGNILLNIGGIGHRPGWLNVNVQSYANQTDLLGDSSDLKLFPDNTVTAIYSSHTLEHTPFIFNASVANTLAEWYRTLRPGGMLMLAVPDMQILAQALVDKRMTISQRFHIMRMIYGAQSDEFDFHYGGFDEDILTWYLKQAGFCRIQRVKDFGLFQDTSSLVYAGYSISLNIVARACNKGGNEVEISIPGLPN